MKHSPIVVALAALFLFLVALGGGYFFWGQKTENCFEESEHWAQQCSNWIMSMVTAFNSLDLNDKFTVNEFLKGCDSIDTCRPHLQCYQEEFTQEALIRIPPICNAVRNFSTQLSDCWAEISRKPLSSVAMWKYYRYEKFSNERILLLEKDTCQMFFGKTGWIKKVIRETCGEDKWDEVSSGNNLLAFGCDMGGLGPHS